jgi:hypothetical protein
MRVPTLLFLLAPVLASCSSNGGTGPFRLSIDPNLPREDPSSYPDNPVVSAPPVFPCPFEPPNCLGPPDSGDAAQEAMTGRDALPDAGAPDDADVIAEAASDGDGT